MLKYRKHLACHVSFVVGINKNDDHGIIVNYIGKSLAYLLIDPNDACHDICKKICILSIKCYTNIVSCKNELKSVKIHPLIKCKYFFPER